MIWIQEPKETGYYWIATKSSPACKVGWYFDHDDALSIMGGPAEGKIFIHAIRGGVFKKAYPEAVFMSFIRPENPMKDQADTKLTSSNSKLAIGNFGEITCACCRDAVQILEVSNKTESPDIIPTEE